MKKYLVIFLFLVGTIVQASTSTLVTDGSIEYTFLNEQLGTANIIQKSFSNAADYQSLDFNIGSVSAGSIPTASVTWLTQDGKTILTDVLKSGSPIRRMHSNLLVVRLMHQTTSAIVRVTGNIILTKLQVERKSRVVYPLSFTVGTTSTSVTVTGNMQGYWYLQTDQKIHISYPRDGILQTAPNATTSMEYLNANSSIDTGAYFKNGEVLKFIAATTTASVRGHTYER